MDLPTAYHSYVHDTSDPFMEMEMEDSDDQEDEKMMEDGEATSDSSMGIRPVADGQKATPDMETIQVDAHDADEAVDARETGAIADPKSDMKIITETESPVTPKKKANDTPAAGPSYSIQMAAVVHSDTSSEESPGTSIGTLQVPANPPASAVDTPSTVTNTLPICTDDDEEEKKMEDQEMERGAAGDSDKDALDAPKKKSDDNPAAILSDCVEMPVIIPSDPGSWVGITGTSQLQVAANPPTASVDTPSIVRPETQGGDNPVAVPTGCLSAIVPSATPSDAEASAGTSQLQVAAPPPSAVVDTPSTVTITLPQGITLQVSLPRSAIGAGEYGNIAPSALGGQIAITFNAHPTIAGPSTTVFSATNPIAAHPTIAGNSGQVLPAVPAIAGTSAPTLPATAASTTALPPTDQLIPVHPAIAGPSVPVRPEIAVDAHASPLTASLSSADADAVPVLVEQVPPATTPVEESTETPSSSSMALLTVADGEEDAPAEETVQIDDADLEALPGASSDESLVEAAGKDGALKQAKKRPSSFCRICEVLLTVKPTTKLTCCGVAVHWSCAVFLLEKQLTRSEQKCPECEKSISVLDYNGKTVEIFPFGDFRERLPMRYSVLRLAKETEENIEALLKRFLEATNIHEEAISPAHEPDSSELERLQKRRVIITEMLELHEKGGMRVESFSVEEQPRPWFYVEELLLQREEDEKAAMKGIEDKRNEALDLRQRAQQLEDEATRLDESLPGIKVEIEALKQGIEEKRFKSQGIPIVPQNLINDEVAVDDDDIEFLFEQKASTPALSTKRKSIASATPSQTRRIPKAATTRAYSVQPRLSSKRSSGSEAPSEGSSTTTAPMLQAALMEAGSLLSKKSTGMRREKMRRADSDSGLLSRLPPRAASMRPMETADHSESIASDKLEEEISNGTIVATPQGWKRSTDEASSHSVNDIESDKDASNSAAEESLPSRSNPDDESALHHVNDACIIVDETEATDSPNETSGSVGDVSAAGAVLDGSGIMEVDDTITSPQHNVLSSDDDETSSPSSLDRSVSPSGSETTSPHEPLEEETDTPLPPSSHDAATLTAAALEASTSQHRNVDSGNNSPPTVIGDEEDASGPSSVAASHGSVSPSDSDNTIPYEQTRSSSLQLSSNDRSNTAAALEASGSGAHSTREPAEQADLTASPTQRKLSAFKPVIKTAGPVGHAFQPTSTAADNNCNGKETDKPVDVVTLLQSAYSLQCMLQASSSGSQMKKTDVGIDSCPSISGVEKKQSVPSPASGSNGAAAAALSPCGSVDGGNRRVIGEEKEIPAPSSASVSNETTASGVSPSVIQSSSVISPSDSALLNEARRIITQMKSTSSCKKIDQIVDIIVQEGRTDSHEVTVDHNGNGMRGDECEGADDVAAYEVVADEVAGEEVAAAPIKRKASKSAAAMIRDMVADETEETVAPSAVRSSGKESALPKQRHTASSMQRAISSGVEMRRSEVSRHTSLQADPSGMSTSTLNGQPTIVLVPPPFASSRARNFGQLPLQPIVVPIVHPESTTAKLAAEPSESIIESTPRPAIEVETITSRPNDQNKATSTSKVSKSWKDEAEKRRIENRIKARAERKAKEEREKMKKEKKEKNVVPRKRKSPLAGINRQSDSTQEPSLNNPVNAARSRAASIAPTAQDTPTDSLGDSASPTVLEASHSAPNDTAQALTTPIVPAKRGRGRPKGSTNKKKVARSRWDSESDDEYVPRRQVRSKSSAKSEKVDSESDDDYVPSRFKRSAKSEQRDPSSFPPPAKIARLSVAADEYIVDIVPSTSGFSASIAQEERLHAVTATSSEETLTYISL